MYMVLTFWAVGSLVPACVCASTLKTFHTVNPFRVSTLDGWMTVRTNNDTMIAPETKTKKKKKKKKRKKGQLKKGKKKKTNNKEVSTNQNFKKSKNQKSKIKNKIKKKIKSFKISLCL